MSSPPPSDEPHDRWLLDARSVDRRLYAPATERNRQAILALLRRVLPARGTVLEIASGTGEHAAWFAPRLPALVWQPSDPDPVARASIDAWGTSLPAPNLQVAIDLDAEAADWGIGRVDAVVCINMIHIAPWTACQGLIHGAARLLPPGGVLYLYGPFKRDGRHTAPSNQAFDRSLRRQDPDWGVRDLADVVTEAEANGLRLDQTIAMPANNLSVVLRR
jgi:SAM-dependent methyltransferase